MAKEQRIIFPCPACKHHTDPTDSRCPNCGTGLIVEPTMIKEGKDKPDESKEKDDNKKTTYKESKKIEKKPKEHPLIGDIIRYRTKLYRGELK